MNENTEIIDEGEVQGVCSGPGTMLREAREAAGISVEDLAQQFRLSSKIVSALEQNDLDALPSKVFVRGYLSSFARALALDPDALLNSYDRWVGHKPEVKAVVANAVFRTDKSSNDRFVRRWGTWVIAAILVILSLVWWQGEIAVRFWGKTEEVKVEQQLKPIQPLNIELEKASGQPSDQIDDQSNDPKSEMVMDNVPHLSQSSTQTQPPLTVAKLNHDTRNSDTGRSADEHLIVRIAADSWVEVVDATGIRLVYDLLKAGSMRAVAGAPPFDVSLGYAPGVTLEFNGEPVKFRRVATDGTTRVKVGVLTSRQAESG